MINSSKIKEKQLHNIWIKQDFIKELNSSSGDQIIVLNGGDYNEDTSGPDFKHARLRIGNITFVGDVEIDRDYSDWKNHGHNINKHYNKVILHVCYTNRQNQKYVYTSEGRKVPSITIKENIAMDNLVPEIILGGKKNKHQSFSLKCSDEINLIDVDDRQNYILQYGINRFENKCQRIYNRLKELKFINELKLNEPVIRYELSKEFRERKFLNDDFGDRKIWNQLLYELIFEALGYSKNKNIMMRLAQNVNLEFLKSIGNNNDSIKLETIYFHVSGLMPEKIENKKLENNYLQNLSMEWENISPKYDGKVFDETQWHFLGQRPQNFPTIRISGGAKIVDAILNRNLTAVIIKKFSEIHSIKVLINSIRSLIIVKANGYWRDHYVFEKKSNVKLNYIIGLSRADEIFINVLLPYLSVYFDIFGNEEMSKKVIRVYNEYEQKSDNKIVKDVASGLKLEGYNKRTIYSQGMIEVYRNYCSKNRCLECHIGKKVFN